MSYDPSRLWAETVMQFQPYAFATVALNSPKSHFSNPFNARRKIDELIGKVFLRVDQEFHCTRNVVQKVRQDQRFEGSVFYEKLDTYPHAHILLFSPESIKAEFEEIHCDELVRAKYLCHRVHSVDVDRCEAAKALLEDESIFLRAFPIASLSAAVDKKSDWDIRPVHDIIGLSSYPVKQLSTKSKGLDREAYEPSFLSSSHSSNQLR